MKKQFAETMREYTATAEYRRIKKEMMKLVTSFSKQRFVHVTNPSDQLLEQLKDEGFTVSQTAIREYVQFKILW